jgi:hypothetical protein
VQEFALMVEEITAEGSLRGRLRDQPITRAEWQEIRSRITTLIAMNMPDYTTQTEES